MSLTWKTWKKSLAGETTWWSCFFHFISMIYAELWTISQSFAKWQESGQRWPHTKASVRLYSERNGIFDPSALNCDQRELLTLWKKLQRVGVRWRRFSNGTTEAASLGKRSWFRQWRWIQPSITTKSKWGRGIATLQNESQSIEVINTRRSRNAARKVIDTFAVKRRAVRRGWKHRGAGSFRNVPPVLTYVRVDSTSMQGVRCSL